MYAQLIWRLYYWNFTGVFFMYFAEVTGGGLGDKAWPGKFAKCGRLLEGKGQKFTSVCMNLFKNTYIHSVKMVIFTEAVFIYALLLPWNMFYKCICNKHAGLYSAIIQTHVISLTLMTLYQHRWGQSCAPFRDLIFEDNRKRLWIEGKGIFH